MKKTTLLFLLFFTTSFFSQELYVKHYGSEKGIPILFLHGGPGYNSAGFELTTAQKLANQGFFVIVYDRRGEGRSENLKAKFTFEETFSDINSILEKYKIKKVSLIGHSFGGIVATLYAEKNPEKVKNIILVGAPVSLQETFKNIIAKSRKIYEEKEDKVNLNYISMLENMDSSTMQFASYCFAHAMQNGFYSPKKQTDEAKTIYAEFLKNPDAKLASKMTIDAPQGFSNNEKYTMIDLTENIKNLRSKKIPVYGLYGKEDGLFSEKQVRDLENIIGKNNLFYFDDCSHNVFIDQQSKFIEQLKHWNK
ncbi:proline iminopeptidase [Flavobacterium arsenatis]|uniref:Proline iminopeptidase n=1 Tax=Flavobacterium arsenatis TaxID=1484332 RepID=A0ABU1TTW3_9FLAO|nr:alpha/beta hydrolase [Flavobacterium arsenatis]MDR6969327.1 proline iminopeptidase [Flavobacterium arsenatis]